MIITLLLNILAILLNGVSAIFNALLSWTFPAGVQQAVIWLFTPLSFFSSFVDLDYLSIILSYLFGFIIVFMIYRIIRFGWSMAFSWSGGHDAKLTHMHK